MASFLFQKLLDQVFEARNGHDKAQDGGNPQRDDAEGNQPTQSEAEHSGQRILRVSGVPFQRSKMNACLPKSHPGHDTAVKWRFVDLPEHIYHGSVQKPEVRSSLSNTYFRDEIDKRVKYPGGGALEKGYAAVIISDRAGQGRNARTATNDRTALIQRFNIAVPPLMKCKGHGSPKSELNESSVIYTMAVVHLRKYS